MSYISGVMVGAALGARFRKYFIRRGNEPSARMPIFALSRAIPGRRRYYAGALIGNDALAKMLTVSLSKLPFIDEVKVNTISGSMLLVFHGKEEEIDALEEKLSSRIFRVPRSPQSSLGEKDGLAAVGDNLRGTVTEINHHIKTLTRGWLDLPSMLSFVFAVRGIQKILVAKQLPSGPQLLWWAFSLLRGVKAL